MSYIINFLNGTNEWEVKFSDGYRVWFDGEVSIETVTIRAIEIAKKRAEL